MRRFLAVLILVAQAFATHGSHKQDIVLGQDGKALAGATVRVCAPNATGAVGSCVPLAPIFSDKSLTVPIVNSTVTADASGNYDYYSIPGNVVADICYQGTCSRFNDYINPSIAAPSTWSPPAFVDDGATDGIVAVYSPQRPISLIRVRVRGDRPWTGCSTSPTLKVTIPQTPPAADLVAGTLTVQNSVVSGAGSAKDYVMSAAMQFDQGMVANSEVVLSWTHGASCSQYPQAVYVTLEFDGPQ